MSYGELHLPPIKQDRNPTTGRFNKGITPFNKGKKWSDYASKRTQKKMLKGWMNVIKHRPTSRPDVAERCRKKVIAVMNDGTWLVFPYIGRAGEWLGGNRENVGRCCRANRARVVNKKTGKVNTDHRYKGIRFYYEDDDIWLTKIKG